MENEMIDCQRMQVLKIILSGVLLVILSVLWQVTGGML